MAGKQKEIRKLVEIIGAIDDCRCGHEEMQHNQITGRCSWCPCTKFQAIAEDISIPVNKGDTILGGRFKNHPIKVKTIAKDDWDMPTVNGRKVVNFRIPREKKEVDEDAVQWGGLAVKQTGNAIIWYDPKTGDVVKWVPMVTEEKDEEDYPLHGKIYWKGIPVDVENARGTTRSGTDPDGHKWEVEMKHHYGRIRNTEAVDGDELDVYVGPTDESEYVYKVKQLRPDTGEFDENKYMLGFGTPQEAHEAYLQQYDKPDFFGGIESIPFDEFKKLVKFNQKETLGNK